MFHIKKVMHANPLEEHYHVTHSDFSCKIYHNLGASIQELTYGNVSVIKGFRQVDDYKTEHTSSILCPFPGRIEHGKYTYNGTTYQLDPNENNRNNAIHGKVAHEFFKLIDSESDSGKASLTFAYTHQNFCEGYPFPFEIQVRYTFTEKAIQVDFLFTNKSNSSIPFGLGWHPYFNSSNLSESILTFNSSREILCDTEMIPQGEKVIAFSDPIQVNAQHFDTCFTLDDDNTIHFQTPDYRFTMNVLSNDLQFIQIFTPAARDCIAIEPMTCAPDVFNYKRGFLELNPNESFDWTIDLNFTLN
jgi:aldose 1-epimerase